MSNPLRQLKFLPWRSLFQTAGLTIVSVAIVEVLLVWGYTQSPVIRNMLKILYSPPLDAFMPIIAGIGVGALAVYLLEQFHRQLFLNTSILWALVFCLIVILVLKSLLPLPTLLLNLNQFVLVSLVVGIFWKGKPYWR